MARDPFERLLEQIDGPVDPDRGYAAALLDRLLQELGPDARPGPLVVEPPVEPMPDPEPGDPSPRGMRRRRPPEKHRAAWPYLRLTAALLIVAVVALLVGLVVRDEDRLYRLASREDSDSGVGWTMFRGDACRTGASTDAVQMGAATAGMATVGVSAGAAAQSPVATPRVGGHLVTNLTDGAPRTIDPRDVGTGGEILTSFLV